MRSGERLFAERGDEVSLRDIAFVAKQRNVNAVVYHFGSRDEFVDCILERHASKLSMRWRAQNEEHPELFLTFESTIANLVALVAEKLDDPDGVLVAPAGIVDELLAIVG